GGNALQFDAHQDQAPAPVDCRHPRLGSRGKPDKPVIPVAATDSRDRTGSKSKLSLLPYLRQFQQLPLMDGTKVLEVESIRTHHVPWAPQRERQRPRTDIVFRLEPVVERKRIKRARAVPLEDQTVSHLRGITP